jgi:SAM-dependent methyltransferase
MPTHPQPDFDRIARPYRWLEYLTLGRALERCRFHFIPRLAGHSRALAMGDGDGRFLARLLLQNPAVHADAVDTSAAMLRLLKIRCAFARGRLRTHQTDALAFASAAIARHPPDPPYDLVVTHFFLDCLTPSEVDAFAASIVPSLRPGAVWLVSDFQIPSGALRLPALLLVRGLYLCFRIAVGLRVTRLPEHRTSLIRSGFVPIASHRSLFGILTTELWQLSSTSRGEPGPNPATTSPLYC